MSVSSQAVDLGGFYVEGKGAESLNRIHEKETTMPFADLANRIQIGPEATEILNKTDRKELCALASSVNFL